MTGLRISSDIVLPSAIADAASSTAPDVVIREAVIDPEPPQLATFRLDARDFRYELPGIARFRILDARELQYQPLDGTPAGDIAALIATTLMGILLHLRGSVVLSASAVKVGQHAALLCGPAAAGKSTMAAALSQRGYPVLADGLSVILVSSGSASIAGSDGCRLSLWTRSIERLGLADRRGDPVRPGLQKFLVSPSSFIDERLPIGSVHVLRETRAPEGDGIRRVNIVDGALLIRGCASKPQLVKLLRQEKTYLAAAAAVMASAPIGIHDRPFDFDALPGALDRTEADWRAAGLIAA
ncbi:MAG: hypothetical protein JSR60_06020 [Proteobacteria bacterium]|nr:hypothetical protein [Pseudomonadota bacterium]